MSTAYTEQQTIPYPLSIDESAQERAAAGERVAQLLDHPGWDDLRKGLVAYQGVISQQLMAPGRAFSKDAADYADRVGELKGLAMVGSIAAGLIQAGEQAEAEIREAEEGGI